MYNIPEVWKVCYQNDNYAVSNYGRVMRLKAYRTTKVGRILKTDIPDSKGYARVLLYKNNKRQFYALQRLIASNFKMHEFLMCSVVHHEDDNPMNNAVFNLHCIGHAANQRIAHVRHKHPECIGAVGENHVMAKLTTEQVIEIKKRIQLGESNPDIAADYPVQASMISLIRTGKAWRHV